MRYMGIDFGKKRVGIALSDEGLQFALPKIVLPNDNKLVENVKKICEENSVSLIVLGESKNYKGEENTIMEDVKVFEKEIGDVTKIPVVYEPEFLTSAEAERVGTRRPDRHGEFGVRSTRGKEVKNKMLDASAAALILKSFIDRNKKNS